VTTIAFDGKTLAADSQTSLYKGRAVKIHRLNDGSLYGASGNLSEGVAVRLWLNDPALPMPKVADSFHAILIRDGQLFALENDLTLVPYQCKYFAVGSGREYAMAAMLLGKTAREAVEVAIQLDINSGGEIQSLPLEEMPLTLVARNG